MIKTHLQLPEFFLLYEITWNFKITFLHKMQNIAAVNVKANVLNISYIKYCCTLN